jgi:4-alpha-glucanotransferase
LWQEFVEAGFGEGDAPSSNDTQPVVDAALAFVAATPSPLCLPPIEDLLGIEEQPNLPGTIDQHPNWRRRLTAEARTLLDEPRIARRVAQLATRRPRL